MAIMCKAIGGICRVCCAYIRLLSVLHVCECRAAFLECFRCFVIWWHSSDQEQLLVVWLLEPSARPDRRAVKYCLLLFVLKSSNRYTYDCVVFCPGLHLRVACCHHASVGERSRLTGEKRKGKRFHFFSSSAMTLCRLTLCCSFIVIAVRQPVLTAKAKVSPKDTEWFFFMCSFLLSIWQADDCAFVFSISFIVIQLVVIGRQLFTFVLGMCATSLGWLWMWSSAIWRPVHLLHDFLPLPPPHVHMVASTRRRVKETASIQHAFCDRI